MKYQTKLWTAIIPISCLTLLASIVQAADKKPHDAVPAGPRQSTTRVYICGDGASVNVPTVAREITTKEFANYPPLFVRQAQTLDPVAIVRRAWKSYLTQTCDPWGMLPGGQHTLRLSFDCRILPWAELKHHGVDGYDNNTRNIGAHAMLNEMLGPEKDQDPIEQGQLGYLLSITDPETGLPYCPESLPRRCVLGHGELAKNVILLYEQTRTEWLHDWAAKMLTTLRRYAHNSNLEDVGPLAEYWQGDFAVGEPPVSEKPGDVSLGGWQHLVLGWNAWAFSQWYELTGDKESLEFALALANRLCHSADGAGWDGSLRPDGSFGLADIPGKGGFNGHMHGHTHGLPGLVHLGGQLIKAGRSEPGLRMITQADRTFEWLYDLVRNPDAGSLTGWLPEFLGHNCGTLRKGDCEGCTMGDIVQTSVALGAASRLDPTLEGFADYYDRAEKIFRGQVVGSIFSLTPPYKAVLKECLQKRVDKEMPDASVEVKTQKVDCYYQESLATAGRMEGRLLGLCGFPDWVNNSNYALDRELPGIDMMGCCADAVVRASHAIWAETVTGDKKQTRVNLAFNRKSPLVDVVSCLPHRGEVNVFVKDARRVLVRIPEWAPKEETKVYVDRVSVPVQWQDTYVVFESVKMGQQLTVTYPLRIAEVRETIWGSEYVEYTEKWRGNTIVDISPAGKLIPMFQRPELESEVVP